MGGMSPSALKIFWDRGLRGWYRPARRMLWSLERKYLSIDIPQKMKALSFCW